MIRFDSEQHEYYLGDKKLIGITKMLHQQGLAPNLDYVDEDLLKQRAVVGDLIHKEIHEYIALGVEPITVEAVNFMKWAKKNKIHFIASEMLVYNDNFAGTLDLMYEKNGEVYISDIKTTSQAPSDYVSWQTGCYKALLPDDLKKQVVKHSCIWCRDDNFKEIQVQTKSDEEIQKLFQSVLNGEQYQVILSNQNAIANLQELQDQLENLKKQQEYLENQIQQFKDACLEEMQLRGIKKYEYINDNGKKLTLTYVAETTRTSFDVKRFKVEHSKLYARYTSDTPIKATLKVSVK